jgi:hypothetical protein
MHRQTRCIQKANQNPKKSGLLSEIAGETTQFLHWLDRRAIAQSAIGGRQSIRNRPITIGNRQPTPNLQSTTTNQSSIGDSSIANRRSAARRSAIANRHSAVR